MKPGVTKRPRRSTTSVPLPASLRTSLLVPTSSSVEPLTARASARGLPGSPVQIRPFTKTRSARPVFTGATFCAPSGAASASSASAIRPLIRLLRREA